VEYINQNIEVIDDESAVLTSSWRMNKASGVINKELWIINQDGTVQLREDEFEVTSS